LTDTSGEAGRGVALLRLRVQEREDREGALHRRGERVELEVAPDLEETRLSDMSVVLFVGLFVCFFFRHG